MLSLSNYSIRTCNYKAACVAFHQEVFNLKELIQPQYI